MGPAAQQVPSRPKCSWDIRSVPWTDGAGDQEQYACSVALWRAFHDKLPESNTRKIPYALQGIMLQSQLYGRALDLSKKIPDSIIQSEQGTDAIVNDVYKRDPLAVVSNVYQDFIDLLNCKRGQSEYFKYFESRFEAQAANFNSHHQSLKLPGVLLAFSLLANANVEANQRISVLASSSLRDERLGGVSSTSDV